jgi:dTDP-4-dehydrorhamnose reductase
MIDDFLDNIAPDVIVNVSCLPVNVCDENPVDAKKVQVESVRRFAEYCSNEKRLVHLSTDMVFSGNIDSNYSVNDMPDPVSSYGKTKLSGEKAVLAHASNSVVIRSALVLGRGLYRKSGFTDWMISQIEAGKRLTLFKNQLRTPVIVNALVDLVINLIDSPICGIVHAGGGLMVNRVEMGEALLAGMGVDHSCIDRVCMPSNIGKTVMQRNLCLKNNCLAEILEKKWGNPLSFLKQTGEEWTKNENKYQAC